MIMQAIKEHNYIPNNSARNLKRTDSKAIAVLIKGISNPFFSKMIRVFEEEIQKKKKQQSRAQSSSPKIQLASRAASELDIRGYETLEAESVVDNYIDSAVMAKLGSVTIIHGKGTGALRKAVHEILRRNKAVKSFRLGRYGEGEAGVTIVELK